MTGGDIINLMFKKLVSAVVMFASAMFVTPLLLSSTTILASSPMTERISVSSTGEQGNMSSSNASLSDDGRFVAFASYASNLVTNDTNAASDIFVRDRQNSTIERISVGFDGSESNSNSILPTISSDGRYVAFHSYATNLVPNDTNELLDIFVYDRNTYVTERVNVSSGGNQANLTTRQGISISPDGRYVSFTSSADNLVSGDSNGFPDVFLRDRVSGTTEMISVSTSGEQGNYGGSDDYSSSVNANGRFVVFTSSSRNLVAGRYGGMFIRDRVLGTTEWIAYGEWPRITPDGLYIAFASGDYTLVEGDNNHAFDIYVYDRINQKVERISISSTGQETGYGVWNYTPSISNDGRFVAFESSDAYILDPTIVYGSWGIFVRDRLNQKTSYVSRSFNNLSANAGSSLCCSPTAMSPNGEYIGFHSAATNLVPGDTNGYSDIFVVPTVINKPPIANAGPDLVGNEGQSLNFDGTGSTDPDGISDVTNYAWDFGDGNTANGVTVNYTYLDNGVYTATLTVTDSVNNTSTDTAQVTINNVAPVVDPLIPVSSVLPGVSVSTNASFTDAGILDTHTAVFDWGDGTTTTGVTTESNGSGSASGSHTYTLPGIYTIALTVTDKDGGAGSNSTTVTVLTPAQATRNLIDLVQTYNLQQGIENSLDAKLNAAVNTLNDLNNHNNGAAVNALQAFINAVNAQRGSHITDAQADILIQAAQQILNNL